MEYDGFEALLGFLVVFLIIVLVMSVVNIIVCWKVFTKAGKPGWHAIIPFLNTYDLFEIAWNKNMGIAAVVLSIIICATSYTTSNSDSSGAIEALASIVSLANLVLTIIMLVKLSKSFGHDVPFAIGLIFLESIFMCILGFDSSSYMGPGGIYGYGTATGYGYGQQTGYGYGQQGGYGQQTGYGAPVGGMNADYATFTSASRQSYENQNGFQTQGSSTRTQSGFQTQGSTFQAQGNSFQSQGGAPVDAAPQNSVKYDGFGSTGNNVSSNNYSETSTSFDNSNPYS